MNSRFARCLGVFALGAGLVVASTVGAGAASAAVKPAAVGPAPNVTYSILNLHTYENNAWTPTPVGRCIAGSAGISCTVTVTMTISTSVGVDFGLSQDFVAGKLNFSMSATSSRAVSCTSPKLAKGQVYTAYALGTYKTYQIKETLYGGSATSGMLSSWQPYTYPAITCRVS